ncbi:hypothetical protein SPAB_00106 [Salmonella enterica subsp. enterica serovar Paratyphi B str. SPB7]|uniref:Uncharacterized protein n=1 Tax=Salmonella paratyphi B (strain ATCC BAA-1250 / SPB7) TaxID=1016998 RepID=A0A6C6YXI7_SALPB|nr:hypothetical protein SPAB_00106 [Salmonella enterica subsp. enterica serovar Paratyphi B str. SPB7]
MLKPVWGRPARRNRSVHVVREDFEHCPDPKWRIK